MTEPCPKCGSSDTASDADVECTIEHGVTDCRIVREFDVCFACGHQWNIEEKEEVK